MRKLILSITLALIGSSCIANTININSAIMNSFHSNKHISSAAHQNALAIIYGGQDFSHPNVAIADESIWSGQPALIG